MILALTATAALTALLLAFLYAAGVHALVFFCALAAFALLNAASVPPAIAAALTMATAFLAAIAVRRAMASPHKAIRTVAGATTALAAGYAGYAMSGAIAELSGVGPAARIVLGLSAGAFFAAASLLRATPERSLTAINRDATR